MPQSKRRLATLFLALLVIAAGPLRGATADGLPVPPGFLEGSKWGDPTFGTGATVTYSYDTSNPDEVSLSSFMPAGYQTQIADALAAWSQVANLTFVEVPSGGDLHFVGGAIDGPGYVGANATYPDASYNRVRFDSGNNWYINPDDNNIREIALHEIGHTLGLLHPPGVIARMDHNVSHAYNGLLPNDVAGIQAIYGPAPGSNPADYLPLDVSTLQVLPSSSLNVRVYVDGLFDVSQPSAISGTLDTRLSLAPDGTFDGVTMYGGNLNFSDVLLNVDTSLVTGNIDFSDVLGLIMNSDWFGPSGHLTPVAGGEFSPLETILGLVGGQAAYNVQSDLLGINESGVFNFQYVNTTGAGPQALGTIDDGRMGQITHSGSLVNLTLPVSVGTTLQVPTPLGEIPISIEATGTIYAQLVPEPGSFVLASLALIGLLVGYQRRRGRA